jgi:hypothetical protein
MLLLPKLMQIIQGSKDPGWGATAKYPLLTPLHKEPSSYFTSTVCPKPKPRGHGRTSCRISLGLGASFVRHDVELEPKVALNDLQ